MAKKEKANKPETDLEKRVREMMDPKAPDPKPKKATAEDMGLPVPKEPLKIKIVRDGTDDEEAQTPKDETPTAPVLADAPEVAEPESEPEAPLEPSEEKLPESEPEPEPDAEETPDEPETPYESEEPIDDETEEAVDDIVRSESDELIKKEDEEVQKAFQPAQKKSFGQKLKHAVADLWKNPKKRKAVLALIFITITVLGIVPATRYFLLNAFGVRVSTELHVLDASTRQPLKNVRVSAHGIEALTDDEGRAKLTRVKMGPTLLKIEKRAFAPIEKQVTLGWGSNPLHDVQLTPTGTQYAFDVRDYLSDKPVVKAEAISGESSAFSDEEGKILLTMDRPDDFIEITIKGQDRREEKFTLNADTKETTRIKMVPARKHAYISRRDGKSDIYAAYADGKGETLVMKATGKERDDMVLAPHPTENVLAVVSTRDGKRNGDGFLLSTLYVIDLDTKSTQPVQTSERIHLINWISERLVYVRVISGASAGNPERNRLMAYHFRDRTDNQLAASNYFNDVMAVKGRVYYAPSGAYQPKGAKLYSVKPDGTDQKTVLEREVWNMFRKGYDLMALSASNGAWYDYRAGENGANEQKGQPTNMVSRVYIDSPDGKQSIWVENRDGKGVLILTNTQNGEEKTLRTQAGLKNPMRWLNNDTIAYRIKTDTETADYVMSLSGGEPKKLKDVTDSNGIDKWYYY